MIKKKHQYIVKNYFSKIDITVKHKFLGNFKYLRIFMQVRVPLIPKCH